LRRNRSWEEYRLELAIVCILKGNYDADDVDLRRWAAEQKRQYKLYLAGKQSSLTFAQIQKLIDIKFIAKLPKQKSWYENCADLMAFRIQFGNFDVAGNTLVPHANFGLGAWVKRQQVQYTLYCKGDGTKSDLTDDRVRLLNDLGFIWSRRINTWNENFQRLAKWKELHGSCQIPDDSKDPELAALNKWVADQRVHYKRQISEEEGISSDDPYPTEEKECEDMTSNEMESKKKSKRKPPKLSPDKIAKLEGIGFEFDSCDAKWPQKLDILLNVAGSPISQSRYA
jgi:hypothetical protein